MNKTHAFRLKPGNDLKKEIESYVRMNNLQAGWISCGVGSLTDYNIRFANQPEGSKNSGHFEIVSLTGTVSVNGSHIHITISDSKGKTIGGHLLDGNLVYTTVEIVIQESGEFVFTREKDAVQFLHFLGSLYNPRACPFQKEVSFGSLPLNRM